MDLPTFESFSVSATTGENEKEIALTQSIELAKAAIEAFMGKECDIAIAVHPHHERGGKCGAIVMTPAGTPIELAAKSLWMALGGLQMIMAEMPDRNDTVN
jgi:hypothetical protein